MFFVWGLYIVCRSPHGERGLKCKKSVNNTQKFLSLSSRRAWIEIQNVKGKSGSSTVALLTESVDWNNKIVRFIFTKFRSLSSRRAWIEIICGISCSIVVNCRSPHGERGLKSSIYGAIERKEDGRSPHGERGLKWTKMVLRFYKQRSLSSRRAWIEIPHISYKGFLTTRRSPHGERGLKLVHSPYHAKN